MVDLIHSFEFDYLIPTLANELGYVIGLGVGIIYIYIFTMIFCNPKLKVMLVNYQIVHEKYLGFTSLKLTLETPRVILEVSESLMILRM